MISPVEVVVPVSVDPSVLVVDPILVDPVDMRGVTMIRILDDILPPLPVQVML
jgi:hypothetical protein